MLQEKLGLVTNLKLRALNEELSILITHLEDAGFSISKEGTVYGNYAELLVKIPFNSFGEINPQIDKIHAIYDKVCSQQGQKDFNTSE